MSIINSLLLIAAICSFADLSTSAGVVRWVNVTTSELLQGHWEPVGVEYYQDLYLARVHIYDKDRRAWYYFNGKLQLDGNTFWAKTAYNDVEYSDDQFQMLTAPPGTLSWVPLQTLPENPFPSGVIVGGVHPIYNVPVYVCRTSHTNTLTNLIPGYMWPDHGHENHCYFPFDGRVHDSTEQVEVLVINRLGILTGVVQEED